MELRARSRSLPLWELASGFSMESWEPNPIPVTADGFLVPALWLVPS